MRVRLIAVGTRPPGWVREACAEYLKRLGARLPVTVTEVIPGKRAAAAQAGRAIAEEGTRVLALLKDADHVIALDERGSEHSTRELATWLKTRMQAGEDLAFVIGGPDGLAPAVLARAQLRLSLSRLTLPHALVRVLFLEQLYRAHSLLSNHPYHRD